MGKKDLGEKRLEDYADVFADIVNVLAFHGERLLKEEDIVPGPTESVYVDEAGILLSQYRDVLQYDMRGKTIISVIGLENQSNMDRDMVLRVMKYNAASYQSQIDKGEACRRPVFTMVLYFGRKPWSGPKTVMETLTLDDISYGKYAGELVMDGRLNVYEIAFLSQEIREQFTSDFRIAADYFCAIREGKEEEFRKDKRAFKHVTERTKKGELISMCTIMDSVLMEGKMEGKLEGEKELLIKQIQNLRVQGLPDAQIEKVLSLPENREWVRKLLEDTVTI